MTKPTSAPRTWTKKKLTAGQVDGLRAALAQHGKQPSSDTYTRLATELCLTRLQVREWFKGQRRSSAGRCTEARGHAFSPAECKLLQEVVARDPYPSTATYNRLAGQLHVHKAHLHRWFSANRRVRRCPRYFTAQQRSTLMQGFRLDPYPSHGAYVELAQRVGLSVLKVKDWFKRTRQRQPLASMRLRRDACTDCFFVADNGARSNHCNEDNDVEDDDDDDDDGWDAWHRSELSQFDLGDSSTAAMVVDEHHNHQQQQQQQRQVCSELFSSLDLVKPRDLEVVPLDHHHHQQQHQQQVPVVNRTSGALPLDPLLSMPMLAFRVETRSTMAVHQQPQQHHSAASTSSAPSNPLHLGNSFLRHDSQHRKVVQEVNRSLLVPSGYAIRLDHHHQHQHVTQTTTQHYRPNNIINNHSTI